MFRVSRAGALALALLVSSLATPVGALDLEAARDQSEALAQALHAATGVPGLSVAIGREGRIVWSQGFGVANLETPVPVTTETRYRCASISKVITVAVLGRLADRGVVDLDVPIQHWLPTFPTAEKPITLRLLAGHLGGIRHYLPKDFSLPKKAYPKLGESLSIFAGDPLVAPPGERYNYSTYGYSVIGAVLEAATGKRFLDLVDEEVVRPLGLRHTGGDLRSAILLGRAAIYDREGDGTVLIPDIEDVSYKWPGGGLLSTPEDLVRFGLAHLAGDYLPARLRGSFFASQKTAAGEETGVGIGWRIGKDWRDRTVWHHSGAQAGARSTLVMYPEQGLVIAVMTNLGNAIPGIEATAQMLAEPFLAEETAAEPRLRGAHLYRGTYGKAQVSGVLVLEEAGGRLRGALSVPPAVGEDLRKQGFAVAPTFPLAIAFPDGAGIALAAATPRGLVPLRLTRHAGGVTASLPLGRETLELSVELPVPPGP